MSKSKNEINEEVVDDTDKVVDEIVEEETSVTEEHSEEHSEEYSEEEKKEFEEELKKLDDGDLPLFNREKMEKLLTYIVEQDKYMGDYNPSLAVELVDSMITSIESVDEIPGNGIIGTNHTVEELTEFSKRLWRVILASQHSRVGLSISEIEENYIKLRDPNVIITKEENYLISYISSAMAILDHSPRAKVLGSGNWTNNLSHNDKRIGVAVVTSHKDPVKRIRSKLNLMNEVAAHLIHSGMVLRLSSPGSLDQALIKDNLVASKIQNSLSNYGTGIDTTSIYTNEILVEHAYRHIVESNIGEMSKETFEENLSVLDLELLYITLAISIYPTGFELHRQCMGNDCDNVDKIMINPRRAIILRKDRLTNSQAQLLTRGFSRADVSVLADYRESLNPDVSRFDKIDDEIYIKYKVPTVAEYKRISNAWLDYLGEKSLELTRGSHDEEFRKRYIGQAMAKSAIMMYSHWVEGVYTKNENDDYVPVMVRVGKGKGITTNAIAVADEELDKFLTDLSLNEGLHNKLVEGINNFIKESTLSVIALAKTKCSKCGKPHAPEGEEVGEELISFNAGELFFTLLHQRTDEL